MNGLEGVVELSTKSKKVTILKEHIKIMDEEDSSNFYSKPFNAGG